MAEKSAVHQLKAVAWTSYYFTLELKIPILVFSSYHNQGKQRFLHSVCNLLPPPVGGFLSLMVRYGLN